MPSVAWAAHQNQHKNAVPRGHQTSEYRQARKRTRKRDNDTCTVCGRSKDVLDRVVNPDGTIGVQLHTHHVNNDSTDHRDENLATQCDDCHLRGPTAAPKK